MHAKKYPFAVRLIGFDTRENAQIAALLGQAPEPGPAYACLSDDSLQEPDLYVVNGDDIKALAALSSANPTALQPALIVGEAVIDFPAPRLRRPLAAARLFAVMAVLIEQRADALALITAAGRPAVPERRRRERLDLDLTDPAEYLSKRRPLPLGVVLIVDQSGAFRDHLAKLMGARKVSIEWTDSAATAVRLCEETLISLVLINTATPGINPYALCASIKSLAGAARIAVVFLLGPNFVYDSARARAAGARGMLDAPIADRHLVALLQKLLSLPT